MKYYIEVCKQYNEYGRVIDVWFNIKWKQSYFFGLVIMWKYIKNPSYDTKERTKFATHKQAQDFIDNVLHKGGTVNDVVRTIVTEQ